MGRPYTNVSEVNTFVFCRRAWRLQQDGAPTSLEAERRAGTAVHAVHAAEVSASGRRAASASWLAAAAVVAVVVALALAFSR